MFSRFSKAVLYHHKNAFIFITLLSVFVYDITDALVIPHKIFDKLRKCEKSNFIFPGNFITPWKHFQKTFLHVYHYFEWKLSHVVMVTWKSFFWQPTRVLSLRQHFTGEKKKTHLCDVLLKSTGSHLCYYIAY